MSFASLLEDLVDIQNELDHTAGASGTRVPTIAKFKNEAENPLLVDTREVETHYRSKLLLVKRFIEYYRQERQLLDLTRSELPKHIQVIEEIDKALQPMPMLREWNDDDARWNIVKGIEKHLSGVVRNGGFANALSPSLLKRLNGSAKDILDKAAQLFRVLSDVVKSPIDPRLSQSTRNELESCFVLLELALDKFDKDRIFLNNASERLADVQMKWKEFIELYTTLPLRLQRRLTIKELTRLHLQVEQEEYVTLDHSGCYELSGVSGSGKSIILVNRALRIATEQPENHVYVLTINRSLATQLQGTLEVINRGSLPRNLRINSVYDLFHDCIAVCLPPEKFRLADDRSGERIDRSWQDFVAHRGRTAEQNVFAHEQVESLMKTLTKRTGYLEAAFDYLRDEVECVQSAYLRRDRELYFEEQRMGRVFPLLPNQKNAILKVVAAWEEYLEAGGLCDIHTVSLRAAELLENEETRTLICQRLKADAILVDEAQDLSTVELIALRHLLVDPTGRNAIFLTGDVCQKVYSKHQAIERAGFPKSSISGILRKNFRNTKQILTAAFGVIASYPPPPTVVMDSITKPELSSHSGSTPLAIDCSGVSQVEYIRDVVRHVRDERIAVVTENHTLLAALSDAMNGDPMINCVHVQSNADIDRWKGIPPSPTEVAVFLSTFDAVKGFEFETVIVADVSECRAEQLGGDSFEGVPPKSLQEGDYWRCAAKMYAACTRARNHLVLTYSGKPSVLLKSCQSSFDWIRAEDRQILRAITGELSS